MEPRSYLARLFYLAAGFGLWTLASRAVAEGELTPGKEPRISVVRNVTYAVQPDRLVDDAQPTEAESRQVMKPLRADVYKPKGPGPYPAVLLIHGGGWTTGSKLQMGAQARRFANHGYVAVSIEYRLAPRYQFPAQVEDCWKAYEWLVDSAEKLEIDHDRIGVIGYSAGAQLACLLATTQPSDWGIERTLPRLRAVVAGGAPCNFEIVPPDKTMLAYWLGGTRNEVPQRYRQASPIRSVSADDPPMFFYHGSDDTVVPYHISRQMADRLESVGVPVEYYLCEQKGHVSAFLDVEAGDRAVAFLDRIMGVAPASAQQAAAKR